MTNQSYPAKNFDHGALNRSGADKNNPDQRPLLAVVDDNDDVRCLLRAMLEDRYRIEEFATAIELLEFLQQCQCDLIISDLGLPLQDGFALIANLKQDKRLSTIPVVAFTANSSTETQKRATAALPHI
jgi:CheY-like chemotaxis protein